MADMPEYCASCMAMIARYHCSDNGRNYCSDCRHPTSGCCQPTGEAGS
ncbi:MAG: hypothetical protein OXK17_08460 [Thaumarchaeota archaeon]|nr:hypothetical protein [Nitrososphaerota archaeon]